MQFTLKSLGFQKSLAISLALFGIVGLFAIIYFRLEVDLPVKIGLAVAAAGIAAVLPGSFNVKSKMVTGGGALGVFAVVMFYDTGQTWLEPITKSPHGLAPVTMSKKQMVLQNGLMSAQFEMQRGQYANAVDIIRQMLKLREDDRLAHTMLGFSYYKLNNFHDAARAYERAFKTDPTASDAASAHNVATSYDVGGDYDKAIEWIEKAYDIVNRDDNPALWRDIVYDRGLFNLIAWIERSGGAIDPYYNKVRSSFKEFEEIGGKSLFTAYNLCCLYSIAGERLKHISIKEEARIHLTSFLQSTRQSQRAEHNKSVIDRLLGRVASVRGPGEPPTCPGAIRQAFADFDELIGNDSKIQVNEAAKKL